MDKSAKKPMTAAAKSATRAVNARWQAASEEDRLRVGATLAKARAKRQEERDKVLLKGLSAEQRKRFLERRARRAAKVRERRAAAKAQIAKAG